MFAKEHCLLLMWLSSLKRKLIRQLMNTFRKTIFVLFNQLLIQIMKHLENCMMNLLTKRCPCKCYRKDIKKGLGLTSSPFLVPCYFFLDTRKLFISIYQLLDHIYYPP